MGLRYKNFIGLSETPFTDYTLDQLIIPEVCGLVSQGRFKDLDFETAQATYQTKIADASAVLNFGLVADQNNKKGFLIDADLFSEEKFTLNNGAVAAKLAALYRISGPVFRNTISDRLHELLEPVG